MTSFLSNVVIHRKEVIYYISPHAGTAEPLRVSPPKAVDYVTDLTLVIPCGKYATSRGRAAWPDRRGPRDMLVRGPGKHTPHGNRWEQTKLRWLSCESAMQSEAW